MDITLTQVLAAALGPTGALALSLYFLYQTRADLKTERARNESLTGIVIEMGKSQNGTQQALADAIRELKH